MCRNTGASRGSLSDLKMGRIVSLNTATLEKIANYFNVSVSYLLANTPYKPIITEDDIKAAFFKDAEELTKEDIDLLWADARDYMHYKLEQRKQKNKSN